MPLQEQQAGLAQRVQTVQQQLADAEAARKKLEEQKSELQQSVNVSVATLGVLRDVIRTQSVNVAPAPKPVQTLVATPTLSARLHAETKTIVPRPLNSYRHCAPLAIEHIQEASGLGTYSLDLSKRSSRVFTDQYKSQEAARAGCSVSDICWFYQMHFEVATGVRLSLSTTLCTKECLASMALNFLAAGLQMGLSAALDSNVTGVDP